MPPNPPNSLICSVFLALATAGPRQCECLEPPVFNERTGASPSCSSNLVEVMDVAHCTACWKWHCCNWLSLLFQVDDIALALFTPYGWFQTTATIEYIRVKEKDAILEAKCHFVRLAYRECYPQTDWHVILGGGSKQRSWNSQIVTVIYYYSNVKGWNKTIKKTWHFGCDLWIFLFRMDFFRFDFQHLKIHIEV